MKTNIILIAWLVFAAGCAERSHNEIESTSRSKMSRSHTDSKSIMLKGHSGCFGPYQLTCIDISQDETGARILFIDRDHNLTVPIDRKEFKDFWSKLQAFKPLDLKDEYDFSRTSADFRGYLEIVCMSGVKKYAKKIELVMDSRVFAYDGKYVKRDYIVHIGVNDRAIREVLELILELKFKLIVQQQREEGSADEF